MYPLFSERLIIEPLVSSDLESFVTYRQNPEIARFQSWEPSYSIAQAQELFDSQIGVLVPKEGQWLQLAVRERSSGELLGDLALHSLNVEGLFFELGFTIRGNHQGKGFAKEAAASLMQRLINEVGAKKFVANTDSRNAPSIKVLLGLGFRHNLSKSWTEEFKNELVTMQHFETQ